MGAVIPESPAGDRIVRVMDEVRVGEHADEDDVDVNDVLVCRMPTLVLKGWLPAWEGDENGCMTLMSMEEHNDSTVGF